MEKGDGWAGAQGGILVGGGGVQSACEGGHWKWKDQEGGGARPYPGKNEPGCRGRTHLGWHLHPLGLGAAWMGWLLLGRWP